MTPDRTEPPAIGTARAPITPDVRITRLANGLEWLHVERVGLPIVDVQIVVRCGAEADTPERAGLTALTAETMEEGTVTRTGHEIADAIDRLGATLVIRPGWDETTIALHTLASRLSDGLAIAADVVRNATFPEREARRRRDERLAALLQEQDEPAALAARATALGVFGADHPYGRSPRGVRATVQGLERDQLFELHRRMFRPRGTFVVSVGSVSVDAMFEPMGVTFGEWRGEAPASAMPPAPPNRSSPVIWLVDRPGAPQSEMRLACAGPPRCTPDFATLLTLNTILGGAFTSRLNLKLREEKGFTYGARSSFSFRRAGGPFVAMAAVATADTAEAVADAFAEIDRLSMEPVGPDELTRAQNYLVLGQPMRLETGSAMAAHLADLHLHGLDASELTKLAERVRAVSAEAILEAARRWLPAQRLAIVVVGDASVVRGPLEALDLGPVQTVDIET